MTVTSPPQKRRTNIIGGDQIQAGAVTYDKIESDLLARIESTTLKAKINYINFTTPDPGEMYLHGLVDGDDADVDGYITYGGMRYIVPRGPVVTQLNQEGYLVYSTAQNFAARGYPLQAGQSVLATYVSDGVWYADNNSGTPTPFTPNPSTDIAIGYFRTTTADNLQSAVIFKDPVPVNEVVITSRRILANSILSEHITAGEILTTHMSANSINADRLLTNTLDAEKITSSTLFANLLLSGSIRTGTTGARVEMTNAGIKAFNSGGTNTIDINSADGSVTITGGVVAGGNITGASISGGTIDIGGEDPSSFHVNDTGDMWLGAANYADAPFKVYRTGALTASDVTITGSTGNIINTTNFVVTGEGDVTADGAVFNSGTINGNFTVNGILDVNGGSIQLTSGDLNLSGTGNINVSQGDVIVSANGSMQSANFAEDLTGWRLGPDGLQINDGQIAAGLIRIGNISNVNMFLNASFEDGFGVASMWAAYQNGGSAVHTVSDEEYLFQSKSQKIRVTASGAATGVFQDIVFNEPLAAGDTITVSYWIKQTVGAQRTARIGFFPYNSTTGAYKNTYTKAIPAGGIWTRLVDSFEATAEMVDGIRVYLSVDNVAVDDVFYLEGAQAQRSAYVTDFQPAPLDIPESYITDVHIGSLGADKLTSATIEGQTIKIGAAGYIESVDWDAAPATAKGWRLSAETGATFQNNSISVIGGGGAVILNGTEFKAMYGGVNAIAANATGVRLAGNIEVNEYGIQSSNYNGINTEPDFTTRFNASSLGWQITPWGDAGFTNVHIRAGLFTDKSTLGGIGDSIQSSNYVQGVSGWAIFGNGDAEFRTGKFRGEVIATSGTFSGALNAATGTFAGNLSAAGGTFSGQLSAATGTFAGQLSAATGTFSGNLSAAGGTFSGALSGGSITGSTFSTASSGARIVIDQTNKEQIKFYDTDGALVGTVGYKYAVDGRGNYGTGLFLASDYKVVASSLSGTGSGSFSAYGITCNNLTAENLTAYSDIRVNSSSVITTSTIGNQTVYAANNFNGYNLTVGGSVTAAAFNAAAGTVHTLGSISSGSGQFRAYMTCYISTSAVGGSTNRVLTWNTSTGQVHNQTYNSAGAITSTKRIKEDITPLSVDSSEVLKLEAREWYPIENNVIGLSDNQRYHRDAGYKFIGLVAEEAYDVNPAFTIYEDLEDDEELGEFYHGHSGIDWHAITTMLLEEVKKLRNDVDKLKEQSNG